MMKSGLYLGRVALVSGLSLSAIVQSFAQTPKLPSDGPVPLARPFASAPQAGSSVVAADNIITSGIPKLPTGKMVGKLKDGLDALYKKNDANRAIAIRNGLAVNSIDRQILTWSLATSGAPEMSSSAIVSAMHEVADWPGQSIMQRNFERAISRENLSAANVISLFSNRRPETAQGMVTLANALAASGKTAQARAVIAPWWHREKLNPAEEKYVLEKQKGVLTSDDHLIRMKAMLLAYRIDAAERVSGPAKARSFYLAFEAVARNRKDAGQRLANVDPSWRKDPVYSYARIQYLRRAGKYTDAANVLLKTPKDAASLIDPDAWWNERRVLSREMLDLNNPKLAYQLAAAHAAESPTAAADAEFHAGWYALRFLNDPKTAMRHFSQIAKLSSGPISLSRAYYWMGRASEAQKNPAQATSYYQQSARFGTTFYGQLAAARLGASKLELPYPKPSNDEKQRFEKRGAVRAILRLEAAGYSDKAGLLYRELSRELKSPGELALLAVMAERKSNHVMSLRIGKTAVLRGINVGALSHPLGAIPSSANISPSGKALAYAIARQESEFNPAAVSSAGARGMLQLMPATAKSVAAKRGIAYNVQRLTTDPAYNATLGAHFLGDQLERFDGSYVLTFVGYNAGPTRANEWINRYGDPRGRDLDTIVDWIERIPYTETRNYVQRVMENYQVYKARLTGSFTIKNDLIAGRTMKN
ncbi:lytic transglycosylase domain-containing protein [Bartonella sp. HY038]|uniref:lytic transglycosylase domain-containing protein n=1 Tax=Bartonella sp. HY038 TaxID=2759660 RepID=UPI0015F827B8|nr:lytic transglycosylase domain-containing protein [Bartonella sp. HY038]